MWAGHFEELGTPSENIQFDSDFLTGMTANVQETFTSCTDDPSGVLSGPLQYEEIARVCSQLKPGVQGFPRPFTHGGICPPIWGGDKALMGGTHEGGHRPYGGDLTLIDYIIN